jgi:hypothetical protein
MAELRQKARWEATNVLVFDRRARVAAELARRTLEPAEAFVNGPAHALACDLYRQSSYWSLRGLAEARAATEAPREGVPTTAEAFDGLWTGIGRAPGPPVVLDPALLERARQNFSRSFVDFAELPAEEQVRTARELQRVAEGLLTASQSTRTEMDAVWLRRLFVLGTVFVVVALGVASTVALGRWREARSDLAAGKPWRASSALGNYGCKSPAQTCEDSPDYFFHTADEDRPWVEIDLGAVQSIAAVRLENRKDCCAERAVPLSVEISTDKTQYREVLHKQDTFRSWKGEFTPVKARYVRLRATRKTMLHLSSVRVLAE